MYFLKPQMNRMNTDDFTAKTTRRGLPPEYMGVFAPQPPPYIPAGNSLGGFLQ